MRRQPNVKEETLKGMKNRFHRTSDELHQFQTPILMPYAEDVLVKVHEISKLESHYDVTKTEGMLSPGVDAVHELVASQDRVLPDIMVVIDEVDLDDGQDKDLTSVLSNVEACPQIETYHRYRDSEKLVTYTTLVSDAKINSYDTTLNHNDAAHKTADEDEETVHLVLPSILESHDSIDRLADVSQQRPVEVELVNTSVILYLSEPHADHTVSTVMLRILYYCSRTSVDKVFFCVSLCLLYVLYCSIVLRCCTPLVCVQN